MARSFLIYGNLPGDPPDAPAYIIGIGALLDDAYALHARDLFEANGARVIKVLAIPFDIHVVDNGIEIANRDFARGN